MYMILVDRTGFVIYFPLFEHCSIIDEHYILNVIVWFQKYAFFTHGRKIPPPTPLEITVKFHTFI